MLVNSDHFLHKQILLSPQINPFVKTKIGLKLIPLPHFLPLLLQVLGNIFILIVYSQFMTSQILKSTFSYQAVFQHDQKSHDKNLNIFRIKRAF